jgi:hypothetical protein
MQGTKQDMISRYQTLMSSVSHNEDTLAWNIFLPLL